MTRLGSELAVSPSLRPVLFVSNGLGEDAIAAGIVKALQACCPEATILALPLVGDGRAYTRLGVRVVGPRRMMPSGGLVMSGLQALAADLRAGLGTLTLRQIAALRALGPHLGAYVAVGDAYPALLGGLFAQQRVLLVGTAKSNWFYPYTPLEAWLFRRFCDHVYARDEATARHLGAQGVPASWVGNAMMDDLEGSGLALPLPVGRPVVALLPGSRQQAYADLPVLLDAVLALGARRPLSWVMALADGIEPEGLLQAAGDAWSLVRDGAATSGHACSSLAISVRAEEGGDPSPAGVEGRLLGGGQEIVLVRGHFADVLQASTLVLGQAGTGNEQAVGLGRPVVSFDSQGSAQPGWYRARQMGLLGGAMEVVPRSGEALAATAAALLDDPKRFAQMQQIGYERMGPPGACAVMAGAIAARLRADRAVRDLKEVPQGRFQHYGT